MLIEKYFPALSQEQMSGFEELIPLYTYWNERINVISRKDIENLEIHHILHSLAIARFISFKPGAQILDVGTGGGFPGIPLAIMFPETQFHLVDSIGKKIKVVNEICQVLQLKNVSSAHSRAEDIKEKYDFVVSRAVTTLPQISSWIKGKFKPLNNHAIPNGMIYLKGGDIEEEIKELKHFNHQIVPITDYFSETFFETKKVVYLAMNKE